MAIFVEEGIWSPFPFLLVLQVLCLKIQIDSRVHDDDFGSRTLILRGTYPKTFRLSSTKLGQLGLGSGNNDTSATRYWDGIGP